MVAWPREWRVVCRSAIRTLASLASRIVSSLGGPAWPMVPRERVLSLNLPAHLLRECNGIGQPSPASPLSRLGPISAETRNTPANPALLDDPLDLGGRK